VTMQPPPPSGAYVPPPPGAYVPPPYQPGPAPGVRYSSRLGRLIAYMIDGFLMSIIIGIGYMIGGVLLAMGAGGDSGALALLGTVFLLLGVLLGLAYKPWFWSRGGQTPGYRIMRLRVVRQNDGGPVSGMQAVGRLLGYVVSSILYLGFIWILFDERRQGWHDKLAGTVVIEV
jgi:uncharacterized RDD family membrane protein YckC